MTSEDMVNIKFRIMAPSEGEGKGMGWKGYLGGVEEN